MENRPTMKNIRVEIEDYPKEDCLKIGRIFIVDIFENRFIKFLMIFFLIFNIILLIIQSYVFLSTFESSRFIIHSPVYFGTAFVVLAIVTTSKFTPYVKKILIMMELWRINIGRKFHRRIMTESKLMTIYFVINTILGLFGGFLYMFVSKDEKKLFFAYDIFKLFSPTWEKILSWIYGSGFILIGLVMPASCNQLVYFTTHIRYQIYVMLHHVENMNRNCDATTELHLPYDENYQKEIKQKLTLIAKRTHHMARLGFSILQELKFYMMLFCLTSLGLGISIMIFFIKIQGDVEVNYLRASVLVIEVCITSVAVITAGQKIEDMNEEGHNTIFKLNWYTWNKENKRIYLIFLLSLSNPFKIEITDTTSVNYNLGLRLVRALYSMMSVLEPSK